MKNNNDKITLLNLLMEACVNHGGDLGGPYFTCPELVEKRLNDYLNSFELKNLKDYEIIMEEKVNGHKCNCYPRIVQINK